MALWIEQNNDTAGDKMNKNDFKNPPKKYRPIPFWSWNEKLDTEETKRQIEMMDRADIGGYFMHARGGLQTEYMGDEWFENITVGIEEAKERGMYAWAYDENGWPSGFANGKISGLGEEYQQKTLRMEVGEKHTERTICNIDGMHFYFEVNPFYVDNLDKKVVKRFIDEVYVPYYEKYGNEMEGFFTDEPQLTRTGIPWSMVLPELYEKEYNRELLPDLIQLFKPVGEYKETRKRYYRLIAKTFSESFAKQVYDWCNEHNLKFTGHMLCEESMLSQAMSSGAVMPNYEYFHIPGMDWLGRDIADPLAQLQVVSAAMQTGKKQILSETFALCGHNVSFSELRRIYEWQMARGVNLLCQHLQGYSLRGIRKRDYPPAMYYQQPWWDEYKLFNDSMTRIGMLIAEGRPDCDTLLIHPQTSVWICFDADKNEGLADCEKKFKDTINVLERKHIQFHLGDETMMERHGRVDGNKLIIGEMEYTTVVLPPYIDFLDNTKQLLEKFKNNGGRIINADEVAENPVTDNPEITYLKRKLDDFDMHYFVNSTDKYQKAEISVTGVKLDIMTGEETSFDKNYTFTPYDSLVVLDYRNGRFDFCDKKEFEKLNTDGEWEIVNHTGNAITLDVCDCYFDGELIGKDMSVSEIQGKACDLGRAVDVRCVFSADVAYVPDNICLVCETPEIFTYKINDTEIEFKDIGYFRDKSFRKSNISKYLKIGKNEIELLCSFKQSEETYDNVKKAVGFEVIRNKLTYDMEIENIYIVGDFSVKTDGEFEKLERNAVRYTGGFVIEKPKKVLQLQNIEQQGFPFFSGRISVKKVFNISNTNQKLVLKLKGINAVDIKINDKTVSTEIWNNSEVDLSGHLSVGENIIELTIVNNLRNLLGPHHLEEGESYRVRPSSFFKGRSIWLWSVNSPAEEWNDGYCFANITIL